MKNQRKRQLMLLDKGIVHCSLHGCAWTVPQKGFVLSGWTMLSLHRLLCHPRTFAQIKMRAQENRCLYGEQ